MPLHDLAHTSFVTEHSVLYEWKGVKYALRCLLMEEIHSLLSKRPKHATKTQYEILISKYWAFFRFHQIQHCMLPES
jgi:hypothetical protein